MFTDGQYAEGSLVQDDIFIPIHRYHTLQLHLRVGHLHVRNTLPSVSEKRSETGHQTGKAVFTTRSGLFLLVVLISVISGYTEVKQ